MTFVSQLAQRDLLCEFVASPSSDSVSPPLFPVSLIWGWMELSPFFPAALFVFMPSCLLSCFSVLLIYRCFCSFFSVFLCYCFVLLCFSACLWLHLIYSCYLSFGSFRIVSAFSKMALCTVYKWLGCFSAFKKPSCFQACVTMFWHFVVFIVFICV